ncbi:MAG: PmoA family protein [Bacteroidales bacterium]|nr:PmoA family protein [Bacteroidales bacterium]
MTTRRDFIHLTAPGAGGHTLPALLIIAVLIFAAAGLTASAQKIKDKGVTLVRLDDQRKVDVYINGKLFTSYMYPQEIEKPFLFPVNAPNGAVITRGYPIAPRKGERVDHPHHIGIWFNHGNVNGLDFWNNSSAIPENKKDTYGKIVHQKIIKAESGKKGILEVEMNWNDNKGNTILVERTTYIFSGDAVSSTIDHLSTLTAANGPVTFGETKEGMFAIRVDRAFEMPSNESLIFTDDKGNPTTVKAVDNTGVTGNYYSSEKLTGDKVWGTRNSWVLLSGTKDNVKITFGIFDHNLNPGFPAYAHARGYGLFSLNNLGQNSYDPKQEKKEYKLAQGESMTLRHRFYVQTGIEIARENAIYIWQDFIKNYK